MIDFFLSSTNKTVLSDYWYILNINNQYWLHYQKARIFEFNAKKVIFIGDILDDSEILCEINIHYILNHIKGNFYAFVYDETGLFITSSAFGILPLYYLNDFSNLASSVNLIKENSSNSFTINKKWIINNLLFNYQFGNDTIFNEINLVPSFSYLQISQDSCIFQQYYNLRNELVTNPNKWKDELPYLSEKFIEIAKQYIPQKDSIISFTGGFDGRTLLSIALNKAVDFIAFSYGKIQNDDVYIPKSDSKKLEIPYFWINLDDEYAKNQYYESAENYIKSTDGANGLLYAHVVYLTKDVSKKGNYLLSGVCGSELFRAAHSSGAVTSDILINLFKLDDFNSYKKLIYESPRLKYLNTDYFQNVIDAVIEESWKYKETISDSLDKNKKLYVFVYEEVFRKFFGPWIKAQMKYIPVRTPYLDFEFFKLLVRTELSGAYSDFLTDNPLKRFKGQVLYAEVIRKTNKKLYWRKTGKGYAPIIVNISLLRPFLLIPFLKKRMTRRLIKTNFDNLGIISGFINSLPEISNLIIGDWFKSDNLIENAKGLDIYNEETYRDNILMSFSIIMYINSIYHEK